MAMDPKRYLSEKRKRLAGSILGFCEGAEWYPELTRFEQEALRQKVLDSVAVYHDAVLDVIKVLDGPGEGVTNQAVWDMLERISRDVRQQRPFPVQGEATAGARPE